MKIQGQDPSQDQKTVAETEVAQDVEVEGQHQSIIT